MKLLRLSSFTTLNKADCVTLAVNGASSLDATAMICSVQTEANDTSALRTATVTTRDSNPIQQFTPSYLAKPVEGCKGALVCDFSELSEVLTEFATYTVVSDGTSSTSKQFVYGTINYTRLDDGYTSKGETKADVFVYWK
jgi:hypothetical protein